MRRMLQAGEASLRVLAGRYGISRITVQKWRRRAYAAKTPMGPMASRSTVSSIEDEVVVVVFRQYPLLPR